jgi:acetylornithine deacetylase/succinyl-diaminopimelate desuccinylase-like protein
MKRALDSLTEVVLARAASYRDEVTELTRRLVSIPTENPPGDGYAPCLDAIAETLDGLGMAPRRVEDCLLGWHGSGTPVVYFHGHYDVVPAQRREQFERHLQLGRLYGRGAVTLRITSRGKHAHVGLQHQGVNAFEHMLVAACALRELKAEVEQRETRFAIEPPEARRSILMMGGRVEGGTGFNAVPSECSFTVDRRINPEESLQTEKARLLAILDRLRAQGLRIDHEVLQEAPSASVASDHPVARVLAEAVETVTRRAPAFAMCPGLLETRFYAQAGVPALAYGPGMLEVSHGPNESVSVDALVASTAAYALAAARLIAP